MSNARSAADFDGIQLAGLEQTIDGRAAQAEQGFGLSDRVK
jgi:hypothetical protein